MPCTKEQMDAAVERYRKFSSAEEYYNALAEDAEFKEAFYAAYARNPDDINLDTAGAHPAQFCVPVPPAAPPTTDFREYLATEQNEAAERRRLGLPPRPQKRMQFVIPNDF